MKFILIVITLLGATQTLFAEEIIFHMKNGEKRELSINAISKITIDDGVEILSQQQEMHTRLQLHTTEKQISFTLHKGSNTPLTIEIRTTQGRLIISDEMSSQSSNHSYYWEYPKSNSINGTNCYIATIKEGTSVVTSQLFYLQ